jgi:outer membrane protein W
MNFQASLSYNYWFTNELAVEANLGYMSSSVNSNVSFSGVEQTTSVITPYYLGGKYAPFPLAIANNIRPFVSVLLGGVTGSGTEETVSYTDVSTSTYSYTVFSFKTGIGADALISKYIKLGLILDYLYMPDFEKSVGTRNNYSGINLSFSFGVML